MTQTARLLALLLAAALGSSAQETAPQPAVTPSSADAGSVPIAPPSWADRRNVFFKKLFGPQALLETLPGATFDTVRRFPHQWGRTTGGIARRIGSQYGQFVVGETIEVGVSALHSEDPRYFRMPGAPFKKRLGHALVSTVIVRKADGSGKTIALARLADVYGSWAVATLWNPPDQRDFKRIMIWGSFGLNMKAASNVFREFWPDIKHAMKH